MIPRIIHNCWFGCGTMPELAVQCIESWKQHMPDYELREWNETTTAEYCGATSFEALLAQWPAYVREAYEARKFAFVSDYVRLWALNELGGIYMDVDFQVYRPFDELLNYHAFAGLEGSKHLPVMMGVIASEAHGTWVQEQLANYADRHFVLPDGSLDLTTNVTFITAKMRENGFTQNGQEQDYKDLHILPVEYFSPRHTTGEYIRTDNTYCEHMGLNSWGEKPHGLKALILRMLPQKWITILIKMKRYFLG